MGRKVHLAERHHRGTSARVVSRGDVYAGSPTSAAVVELLDEPRVPRSNAPVNSSHKMVARKAGVRVFGEAKARCSGSKRFQQCEEECKPAEPRWQHAGPDGADRYRGHHQSERKTDHCGA